MSPKERKLFELLDAKRLIELVDSGDWEIYNLYRAIGEHAFLHGFNNKEEPGASLARILIAWKNTIPFRNTPEFEALIKV